MENSKKYVIGIISGVLLIASLAMLGSIVEHVDNGEILVIQDAVDGELHVYSTAGYHPQWFGTPTHYTKSFQFWFQKPTKDDPSAPDKSIKIRFNDGGHADVSGSARINLPLDEKSVIKFHTDFRSQESIEQQLIRTTMEKSVYMTGPLMSSKQSNAEKRNDLITYMEDQASLGVYKTKTVEKKIKDELSGTERTVSEVVIQEDTITKLLKRQEISPLKTYNISLNTLSLNSIDYDPDVEKQIKQQQSAIMQVQTAMANAKRAEQEAITVEKQGEANAAKAKWEMEVIKAKNVTEGQMKLEVQKLATTEAEFYKQQQILQGQGDAEKKKLLMFADGALEQKLATIENMTASWADAWAKRSVPSYYISGGGSGAKNPDDEFYQFMQLQNISNTKVLGLDLTIPKGGNK